jgi:hypothetical protein
MAQRPNADDLKRLRKLSVMPTEKVYYTQSYVDRKTGADGKPLCSAIVALLTDDPTRAGLALWSGALAATGPDGLGAWPLA